MLPAGDAAGWAVEWVVSGDDGWRRRPHMRFPSHKEDCRCRIQQTAASSEGGVDMAEGWRGRGRGRGWAGDEESLRRRLAWASVRLPSLTCLAGRDMLLSGRDWTHFDEFRTSVMASPAPHPSRTPHLRPSTSLA
jgi:hypothetical protein